MLNVTGLNHFYYIRNFTDMRCKHPRVLSVIREQLRREPSDGFNNFSYLYIIKQAV